MLSGKVTFYYGYSTSFATGSEMFLTNERCCSLNVGGRNLNLIPHSGKWMPLLPPEAVVTSVL